MGVDTLGVFGSGNKVHVLGGADDAVRGERQAANQGRRYVQIRECCEGFLDLVGEAGHGFIQGRAVLLAEREQERRLAGKPAYDCRCSAACAACRGSLRC